MNTVRQTGAELHRTKLLPIYSVSQVGRYIRETVEQDQLLSDIYVNGEVSNFTRAASGHCYFTLKDGENQIRCVMFSPGLGSEHLNNGTAITTHGRVSFYLARGDLQLYADLVQPEGMGELHMEFLRVRTQLNAEGFFDESRKRKLPAFPKRIAVITSLTGSVRRDIQTVIARRYPIVELILVHSTVQGAHAVDEITMAFRTLASENGLDIILLARGGGSIEELAAFNHEQVARAIHASPIPVVSAVGHETDTTIADLVADLRAPTPSAAAEMIVPDADVLKDRIVHHRESLSTAAKNLFSTSRGLIADKIVLLDRLSPDLAGSRQTVDELTRIASAAVSNKISLIREQLDGHKKQLHTLHPQNTLSRGYALVERKRDKELITHVADSSPGDAISIQVSDGSIDAEISGPISDSGKR
ncbi:exodeoxyribonuclease VII large subunit, partial [Dehalococcoidia bacterium]|nr:exodeoxyribonuclease VII large subunit [Dehalococcoidia bacterium]